MIEWNINPEIVRIGAFAIRWYGLLFVLSFLVGMEIMSWIFRQEKKNKKDLEDLAWYVILGTIIGARLGHCLFYNPSYYLSNPLEILAVWHGGLASHGAAIGILIAIYIYTKKTEGISYLWIFDRLVITVALGGAFIRIGNLMNSEIYGKPTNSNWGFIFTAVDDLPRHPTQIYEALAYFIIFIILFLLYKYKRERLKEGELFGYFLIGVFGFRIFVEYFKENQEAFEYSLPLNMGQLLSIPLVIFGLYLVIRKVTDKTEKKNIKKGKSG